MKAAAGANVKPAFLLGGSSSSLSLPTAAWNAQPPNFAGKKVDDKAENDGKNLSFSTNVLTAELLLGDDKKFSLMQKWSCPSLPNLKERTLAAEIVETPELEISDEHLSQVFESPKLSIKKLPSIEELDTKRQFLLPSCHDAEINLGPFISNLLHTSQVIEEDLFWDTNTTLSEVLFKINAKLEPSIINID